MTTDNRIQDLVIVGGGTAGWMAAASLQQHFAGTPLKITLVESPQIGTVGVGEATTPTIRRFYQQLGLDDLQVMRAVGGTCKLGIQFNHWRQPGHSFFHPFSVFGQDLDGVAFHHYWLRAREIGLDVPITDFSLGASLALDGRFSPPSPRPPSTLSVYDWALHLDAGRFAELLRDIAVERGVTHLRDTIVDVRQGENGFIRSLQLASGAEICGDLFIDCSGFNGLLIEKTLNTGFEDWGHWLLCDSAWVAQTERGGEPAPYTKVDAHCAGWRWRIPLQHRDGNGHVFSSRYRDKDQARKEFVDSLESAPTAEPRLLRFLPGRRKQAWNRNVIALGLAAGFLEPLESTSIAMIETGIARIKQLFPDRSFAPEIIDEFNEDTRLEYERVRDFLILHYALNRRQDSDFWRDCRQMWLNGDLPQTLQKKMALFKLRGHLIRYRWEMFQPASWLAIYAGFGLLPQSCDPAAERLSGKKLVESLRAMRAGVQQAVQQAPAHGEFLARYCGTATETEKV
ncbi:tryptophan halogenase family protein [Microbulbifer taiwanensis]|uniref:Tryptophan halogenase family protein n=1 Tax=Microbulbifer taiwanensis TaxID=986746 RepID=A0ABW1YLF5_9GAMM|nr:tryptophan halogenase family protein [Microbulbifer taiwanensis]